MSRSSAKKANKNINITDIVSHNLRGLKSDDRIDEIFNAIKSRNIFAACIQETWREGVNALTYEQSKILLAGLEPDEVTCNRGSQGVGIILSTVQYSLCALHEAIKASQSWTFQR